jgi:hypothetical protein
LTGPAYHSGLQGIGALEAAGPCDRAWSPRGSVVFRHDLQDFAPAEFDSCDVVYAELPWKGRNLNAFDERAGVKTNWSLMMASAVQWLGRAKVLGVPTIYPVGRWHMRYLPDPDLHQPFRINGVPAGLYCYGFLGPVPKRDVDLIEWLVERFTRVGDFACGYGRTGRAFAEAGKTFVMSDYNTNCVGYIAEHMAEWEGAPTPA